MNDQNTHTDFESLCAGYVLGSLSPDEEKQFEEMLSDASPEQEALYRDMLSIRDDLALATQPASPSEDVEARIFSSIQASGEQPTAASRSEERPARARDRSPVRRTSVLPAWGYQVATALLLLVSVGLTFLTLNLNETVDSQEATITQLETELEQRNELLSVLAAREARLINMGGLEPSPDGYGKIVWAPDERRAILQMAHLPPPPADKDYQLWLIKEEESPISAGVFNFDESSRDLFFKVDALDADPSPEANAFAVTLEPEGGMPQPTGDMFLLGEQA